MEGNTGLKTQFGLEIAFDFKKVWNTFSKLIVSPNVKIYGSVLVFTKEAPLKRLFIQAEKHLRGGRYPRREAVPEKAAARGHVTDHTERG